jgi:D-cysteine desulfhydrase
MNLSRFPRRRYTAFATPIEFLPNLTRALNGPNIYIKRDDMLGLFPGGNKTRKLEFLMADALAQGADTIITCGAPQSNHCRITLAAAVKEGLKCQFVIEERVPSSYDDNANGNHFMFRLMGVEDITVVPGGSDMLAAMTTLATKLTAEGRRPYIIPGGGSNAIGALGYVACVQEMMGQLFECGLNIDHIVVGSGSSGTHAGVVTGLYAMNANIPVMGIGVSRDPENQEPLVYREMLATAALLGLHGEPSRDLVKTDGRFWRPKYSLPNKRMVEAVQMLARLEAIPLDPTYTGKVMAGLIGLIREGVYRAGENVLFIHTGGMPSLFAANDIVLGRGVAPDVE